MNLLSVHLETQLGFLDMLGGSELTLIFLLVLLFFGGEKMPEVARSLAKAIREFKKAAAGVEQEFKRAIEEEPKRPAEAPPATLPTVAPAAESILPPDRKRDASAAPDVAGAGAATEPTVPRSQAPSSPAGEPSSPDAAPPHDAGHGDLAR